MGSVKRARQGQIEQLTAAVKGLRARLAVTEAQAGAELIKREAAQNGLTPYVYAIQALNVWLNERPRLMDEMRGILIELGLYGVEVGYDPQKDGAISIISATRPQAQLIRTTLNDQQER